MIYSNLTKLALSTALILGFSTAISAQQTEDAIETIKPLNSARFDSPEGRAKALGGTIQSRPIALVFTSFDSNNDRLISLDELDAGLNAEWSMMQTNFSGKVSPISMEKWQVSALGSKDALPSRVTFDTDLDTMVSKAEFTNLLTQIFNDMDKDNDRALSREELTFTATRRVIVKEKTIRERQSTLPRRF